MSTPDLRLVCGHLMECHGRPERVACADARGHRAGPYDFAARIASVRVTYAVLTGLALASSVTLLATVDVLVPDRTISTTLLPDGEAWFELEAAAGDAVRVRVDQRGIDVSIAISAPDGRRLLVTNTSDRAYGTEVAAFVADASGTYRLTALPVDRTQAGGRLDLRLTARHPARDDDRAFIDAMRTFGDAVALKATAAADPSVGRQQALIDTLDAARQQFDAAGDRWGEARALLEGSIASGVAQRWDGLEQPMRRALALWDSLDDPYSMALASNLEGMRLAAAGRPSEAATVTRRALDLARTGGDDATASLAANNLGIITDTMGDAEGAYDLFQEALTRRQRAGRGIAEGSVLTNLARLAANLGDVDTATATYTRALELATAANERVIARTITNNLANLRRNAGDIDKALELHRTSLELSRALGLAAGEAQALNGIGTDLFQLGRYAEAESAQQQSLALRRSARDVTGIAATLQNLGETLTALGRHDEAVAALQESRGMRERTEDVRALPGVWRAIGEAERARGRTEPALAAIETSLTLVEELRDKLTAPALRASFVAREHAKYELHVDLLMDAFRQGGDAALERRAFEAADRARARVLIDALWSSRVDIREGVAPELLRVERELQTRVADAGTALSRALTATVAAERIAAARAAFTAASRELDLHQARLLRDSPAYAALVRPTPVPLDAVQRDLLDEDTVLLEYAVGATRSWLWVVSRDTFDTHELPGRDSIEAAVRTLRAHYEARVPRPGESAATTATRVAGADAALPAASAAVSRVLLGPVAQQLGGPWRTKRLAIVASEALEYLSLAALPVPGSNRPLVETHEIVYLPSASALGAVRSRAATARRTAPHMAIVADPVFDLADPRLPRNQRRAAASGTARAPLSPMLARAVRGFALDTPLDRRLSRLTFSRLEASAIARLLPAPQVRLATGFAASREAVTTAALGTADIVHLATHGLVSTSQPALTGLVVSLVDSRGRARDGFVRLSDVYNLRLAADLVVLSACHTALGTEVRGEGLVGLTRGFMYAGARRVVASLWAVDDSATAELMSRFYRGLLRDRLPAAAALRAAQRELASRPQWAAPYYWAGFVLQGDWQ